MPSKKSILDLNKADISGKRVFVRVDFNVPLNKDRITDDTRIQKALPTIRYLIQNGAKVILASHLGRPKGKVDESLRLTPISKKLSELLGQQVLKTNTSVGEDVTQKVKTLKDGEVLLLENIRFNKEEAENDPDFAKQLADLADFFVNDAFGAAHRAHASTVGITGYLPAYAGILMQKEIGFLGNILKNPQKPLVAIIGGAKISSKIAVLKSLLTQVDTLIIGGAMVFTILKAQGYEIGTSLCEIDKIDEAKLFLEKAKESVTNIVLPQDQVVVKSFDDNETKLVDLDKIPANMMGVDIGPKSIADISGIISKAKTVFWNGPLGVFEKESFSKGTFAIAKELAYCKAKTIIGGGDSVAALKKSGLYDKISHVSTGGGASLEFLEGRTLPGVAALEEMVV